MHLPLQDELFSNILQLQGFLNMVAGFYIELPLEGHIL